MPAALAAEASDQRIVTVGTLSSPTPAAEMALDLNSGAYVFAWTAAQDETITATGKQLAGQTITCIVTDSGTRTLTFSTGFKPTATLVGTNTKVATITFRSNGTSLYEISRAVEITA